MRLFWEKGIEGTSIQDLVDCMGIGRASIYDTFGSKEELLFEALDCYVAHMKAEMLGLLSREGPAPQVIRELFVSIIERGHAGDTRCCLMTKSALMTGRQNDEIMARVGQFMDLVEQSLFDLLERGQREGDIALSKCPRALARFFANSMQGISVTSRTRADRRALEDVVETTLSVLR